MSHDPGDLLTVTNRSRAVARLRSQSRRHAVASLSTAARINEGTRIPSANHSHAGSRRLGTAVICCIGGSATDITSITLSPTSVEQAVVEIFADVSRETVLGYDDRSIHHNVGEILPGGVSILLRELPIDERDKFVDIGVGLGNVIAQVVLQTKVYRAIGIDRTKTFCEQAWTQ
ncbi:hypothetical protein PC116_g7113 [Phytophthora cactorum]|uniref:Uncharacterized protein n=1 Tax=Phytophthora cactorum TaxID=29920 RepID=A0A329R8C4_9STRA|nr:hypothetical protein Pcac1_g22637 [Phytophthora cactorum]KAG2869659.1 hypothetical protein PC114_g27749 [Phytophthora cactorum]KAG2962824.1 hypothetical protein PC120_g27616 [Phytophthora cactorum]KAG3038842.1 hypothetical protein PC119_g2633 [Phytophthora cactorum]KAG3100346.1 hypothetical protein PC122_g3189 [Phytophthora cactorum]